VQPTGRDDHEVFASCADWCQQQVVEPACRIVDHLAGSPPRGILASRTRQAAKPKPQLIEGQDRIGDGRQIVASSPTGVNRNGDEPVVDGGVFDETAAIERADDGIDVHRLGGGVGAEEPPGAATNGTLEPAATLLEIAGVAR
jgi:hypothetical protein